MFPYQSLPKLKSIMKSKFDGTWLSISEYSAAPLLLRAKDAPPEHNAYMTWSVHAYNSAKVWQLMHSFLALFVERMETIYEDVTVGLSVGCHVRWLKQTHVAWQLSWCVITSDS